MKRACRGKTEKSTPGKAKRILSRNFTFLFYNVKQKNEILGKAETGTPALRVSSKDPQGSARKRDGRKMKFPLGHAADSRTEGQGGKNGL